MVWVNGFLNWGMEFDVKTPTGRPIWVYPPPFCSSCFINYPRYRTDDALLPVVERPAANPNSYRITNVCFEDKNFRRRKNG